MSDVSVISPQRWQDNWRALALDGAVRAELPRSAAQRAASLAAIRELEPGSPVVLSASAPGAARRCRAFASAAGLDLEREYLAFPAAAAPAYLVEDARATVRLFIANFILAPPGRRFSLPINIGLDVLRFLKPWRLVRLFAPGRVVVARRT